MQSYDNFSISQIKWLFLHNHLPNASGILVQFPV